jgi:putative transcriptional regulator
MAAKSRTTGRKITYDVITAETHIYSSTLTKMANNRAELISVSSLDRLCTFFDCQPGDLLIYVTTPEPELARQL